MTRVLLFLFLAMLAAGSAEELRAQGFGAFNGRNHPELSWRVATTEHFEIAYPSRVAGIEIPAASIAEATYRTLEANLNVSFDSKIRIYLSDEDENVNGFAVPIGAGHTNIWVNVNDVAVAWTGNVKWLRKVLAHELTHIFHYKAVRSNVHPFDFVFANPLPSFWTEGIAQYETEKWDAFRGEQILRTAVLDDQLSYSDGRSVHNGSLRYAVGNSQVRFYAEQYGDSTLSRQLRERETALLGVIRYHDFGPAFREATGDSYREFYDRWRRHVNIRYNTMAGVMENADSLGTEPLKLPDQYLFDAAYSPDRQSLAIVSIESMERPIRRLVLHNPHTGSNRVLFEGPVHGPVSWSPDGSAIVFTRTARDKHGSLLNDLYSVSTVNGAVTRMTVGRRASFPTLAPDGRTLAFVASEAGNGNIFTLDLQTNREIRRTSFSGDTQIGELRWHPDSAIIAYSIFREDGTRAIEVVDVDTGASIPVTDGHFDDRGPVWSPDGLSLAYSSLRDDVPNIFVCTLPPDRSPNASRFGCINHRRITNLVTGAQASDWIGVPDSVAQDSLDGATSVILALVTTSKARDTAYLVSANRKPWIAPLSLGNEFRSWTAQRPPNQVPDSIRPDSSLIQSRGRYKPLRNLTHVVSLVSPYISTARYGIGGLTVWSEPLGKHMGYVALGIDARDPANESGLIVGYINNTLRPSIETEVKHLPDSPRPYGRDLLLERLDQITIHPIWQLNSDKPFLSQSVSAKVGFLHVEPREETDFSELDEGLPVPETGQQFSLRLSYTRKRLRPWVDNLVHPIDGFGFRVRVTGAAQGLQNDQKYLRLDASSYRVLPSIGRHRIFVYGRAQAQWGESLAQDFLGLSRYDILQIAAPSFISFQSSNSERVRGFRNFVLGKAILFGTAEYRIPLTRSLSTEILGLIGFGSTSVALFADASIVSPDIRFEGIDHRLGLGVEIKNALTFGGTLSFMHAVGIAQQSQSLGTDEGWEIYYRIRTTLPF